MRAFSFAFIYFFSCIASAASCCGGGFAIPSLITGEDKAQLTSSLTYSKIDTDVLDTGIWRHRTNNDVSQILKIEAAKIFNDRYQYGISIPIQSRMTSGTQGGEASGLGDIALQTGYEFLPDWDYNPWRPKGVGFISLTLPTGKSALESDNGGLDTRGNGFWALGIGTSLSKTWNEWDATSVMEAHHSFEKNVSSSQVNGLVKPGNGGSLSIGAGYNIKDLRIGSSVAWTFEDAISTDLTAGTAKKFATGTISGSYLFKDNWAGTFSYSDQTLFGDPLNTTLAKSAAIFVQKKWAR
jgi:hypothetical protein